MRTMINPPIKESATMAMNTKISQLRAEGHQVYHLGFGESKFPVHPKVLAAFQEHATARSYLPVAGLPELRKNVADYYRRHFNIEVAPERVMIGSGSKTILFAAMTALTGDVLLPAPTWVSYDTQAYLNGKAVTWLPTSAAHNYCPTAADLAAGLKAARAAGQNPGILVLTSPGNPTSSVYPPALLAELTELARREELAIISDEIYALTTYGDVPFVSAASYYPEHTVVTGGLSKHLSLGGWRLGVGVLPPGDWGGELFRYMIAVGGSVWTMANAPVQYAAAVAYSDDPDIDAYAAACTAIHGHITTYLYDALDELGVPCSKPGGGFYVYPSFAPWREALAEQHGIRTSAQLADFLLNRHFMACLPGSDFGVSGDELTLRLSTSYLHGFTDAEGWAMLDTYHRNLSRDEFVKEACPAVMEVAQKFADIIHSLSK